LNALAEVLRMCGPRAADETAELYSRAVQIGMATKSEMLVCTILANLGALQESQGQLEKVHTLMHLCIGSLLWSQAYKSYRQCLSMNPPMQLHIDVLNSLGVLLHSNGRDQEARTVLQEAVQLCERYYGPKSIVAAKILLNIANVCISLCVFDEAMSYIRRTKHIDTGMGKGSKIWFDAEQLMLACRNAGERFEVSHYHINNVI